MKKYNKFVAIIWHPGKRIVREKVSQNFRNSFVDCNPRDGEKIYRYYKRYWHFFWKLKSQISEDELQKVKKNIENDGIFKFDDIFTLIDKT